ncbi:hypothetical protein [Frigoribacterium sp. UYMn621]|uniref:hypothetical protein n=1 Tax=Frigoribacterium sp. UYMn621 TaxID=3156343 RepID=UPI00339A79BE
MTDTTLAPAAPVTIVTPIPVPVPLIAPDLSNETVDKALVTVTETAAPFLPPKVRAAIYTVGGIVAVAAGAAAPVIGGTIGVVLESVAAAAAAVISVSALSHISK